MAYVLQSKYQIHPVLSFQEPEINNLDCLKKLVAKRNCTFKCFIYNSYELPPCNTVEEQICMWKNLWDSDDYRNCYKFKRATIYSRQLRIEHPYHELPNASSTEILIGMWSKLKTIKEEVPLLTAQDLIGSVGGSLGMFFGFSLSAPLFYASDKVLNKLFF